MICEHCFVLLLFSFFNTGISGPKKPERLTYISVEHPNVTYKHPDYVTYAKLTSQRYGRASPVYYVGLDLEVSVQLDNTVLVDFYFYEWLTNRYARSFVEMHFKWCNLIEKDQFFGTAMRQGKLLQPCPHPPGFYSLVNMTILPDAIPRGFPFTKGRIYMNATHAPRKMVVLAAYIDMELRTIKVEKRKQNEKL